MLSALTILTPELAPQSGGLADHTALLASALARSDVQVTVIAPGRLGRPQPADYRLVELPGHFGPLALLRLRGLLAEANRSGAPVLVQYVPHGYGAKGMNLALVGLLCTQVDQLWTLFHEVNFPRENARNKAQLLLAGAQYLMASRMVHASARLLTATSAWNARLRSFKPDAEVEDLPIFSNIPPVSQSVALANNPYGLLPGEQRIAHFGTYGPAIAEMLLASLPPLLAASARRSVLLMGRGAGKFARRLSQDHGVLTQQIHVVDDASALQIASGLASAAVVLQPYPDGATTRRGSLLAALAQGCAVVSTTGALSEPFWENCKALALVAADDKPGLIAAVERLLTKPAAAQRLRGEAVALYAERFSPEKNVATLLQGALSR